MRKPTIRTLGIFICIAMVTGGCESASSNLGPSSTDRSRSDFDYLYIVESGEQIGGIPADQNVIYVAADGLVQISRETSADVLLALGAAELDTSDLLAMLSPGMFPRSSFAWLRQLLEPRVESEWAAPSLYVEAGRNGALPSRWTGDPAEIPAGLDSVVSGARALGTQVDVALVEEDALYLRAHLLESREVREARRAELVVDTTDEELSANPPLDSALSHVRRLVQLPGASYEDPVFQATLSQGRSLHISVGNDVFQVRHLRVVQSAAP